MPLALDFRITHDRFGSSSDSNLNGQLHYPKDIDRSLNESDTDKIRKYISDYYNNLSHVISSSQLVHKVQNAFIAKWLSTVLSQMSILTVGSNPDRGMRFNLPIVDPVAWSAKCKMLL
jgi:hypothetical protein